MSYFLFGTIYALLKLLIKIKKIMLTIRNRPFNYLDDFNSLIDNIFDDTQILSSNNYHFSQNEKEIIIELPLPGIEKKDLELSYSNGYLKIKYESKNNKNLNWVNSFQENIEITEQIDENKINAKFKNGLMVINIPKKIKVIKEKIIEIK